MIHPETLSEGSSIRVIAPSYSLRVIGREAMTNAQRVFEEDLHLSVTFGEHTNEIDEDSSSGLSGRLDDFHEAFADPSVDSVITALGGYSANQLIPHIDWGVVASNPKPFCGFSDITAIQSAILANTGLVSYSGPNYSSFGQRQLSPYTLEYFKKCLFGSTAFDILPSKLWSDDPWYRDQQSRLWLPNEGPWTLQKGNASGTLFGTTLSVINIIQGTDAMPNIPTSVVLALEDHGASNAHYFERDLESLFQSKSFKNVVGLMIGRFQKKSQVSRSQLERIVRRNEHLSTLPVIANVDFGHTDPIATLPIGGQITISAGITTNISVATH